LEHKRFLEQAYLESIKALKKGEVPVGAVVVKDGKIISKGHNQRISKQNPLYHAEIVAIQEASKKLNSWRLDDCILYTTLEPCAMCAGAVMQARIKKVIFCVTDTKGGAVVSNLNIFDSGLPFRVDYEFIQMDKPKELLQEFFKSLRK